jgi:Tol biopolymer transport system component
VGQSHALSVSKQARWLQYAVSALALTTLGLAIAHFRHPVREESVVRTSILPPGKSSFTSPAAVSPDGRRLIFGATAADGKSHLWVRPLDTLAAQLLGHTEGATHPFWSADGRFVAFFADGKLKKIDVSGGSILTLCDAPSGAGGTWSRDGVIVFGPGSGPGPLHRVSAAGGVSSPVTVMDQSRAESHHRWPWFLPDGRHFVYSAGNAASGVAIRVASVDSNDSKVLLESPFNAVYAQGYLLFLRESTLMAQPFDTKRLAATADAVPVAEQIQTLANAGRGVFSVSENGSLIYRTGTTVGGAQLVWFDRSGKPIATLGDPGLIGTLHLSPNQKNVAVSIRDPVTHNQDIWIYDLSRGLKTRFTSDQAEDRDLIWSPDGRTTVFSSNRKGHFDLFQKPSNGAISEELLYADSLDKQIRSWSPDGKFLLYSASVPKTKDETWVLPMTGEQKPFPFAQTTFNVLYAQFSPDGRWVAYTSDESQRAEVYVAPFPGTGRKWQISTAGGSQAVWRGDGREIFYMAPDNQLMAASLNVKGDVPVVGAVQPLFGPVACAGGYCYAASSDGQRFLVRTESDQTRAEPLTLVLNWTDSLNK